MVEVLFSYGNNKPTSISRSSSNLNSITYPQFPEEIILIIIQYMDIPSLANVIQTCKQTSNSFFSTLLLDDKSIWLKLVRARFHIRNLENKRPKSFGGATWKAVYRCLMCTCRIPRCRLLTRKEKIVFAKPISAKSYESFDGHEGYLCSPSRSRKKNSLGVCLWVSVGHTSDCNTRSTTRKFWNMELDDEDTFDGKLKSCASLSELRHHHSKNIRDIPRRNDNGRQRFMELHLCLQNNKSSNGCIHVDFSEAFIQQVGSKAVSNLVNVNVQAWGKYKPKLLYLSDIGGTSTKHTNARHHYSLSGYKSKRPDISRSQSYHDKIQQHQFKGIKNGCFNEAEQKPHQLSLHPFQFAIVAVNVPCSPGMNYEPDFLSNCLLMHVPVTLDRYIRVRKYAVSKNSQSNAIGVTSSFSKEINVAEEEVKQNPQECEQIRPNVEWVKEKYRMLVTASFLPEADIWDQYMQLPGGYIALSDQCRSLIV